MDPQTTTSERPDALDHPIFRIAHLHGSEWVTLRPEQQHSPRQDESALPWPDGTVYECETCGERVLVAST
jgi:hypothetical protein